MEAGRLIRLAAPIGGVFFVCGMYFGIWASRIPTLKEKFELSPGDLGLLLLVVAAGGVVAFQISGWCSDRFGARLVTRISAVSMLLSCLLIGLASTIPALCVALFLFGAFFGGTDVAMNTGGTVLERKHRVTALPVLHAIFSLGGGAGAASGYFALEAGLDITRHVAAASAPLLVLSLLPGGMATDAAPRDAGQGKRALRLPLVALLVVGIVAFASTVGEGGVADWGALFLVEQTAVPQSRAALGFTVFSLGMVAMRLAGGYAVRALSPGPAILISGAVSAAGAFVTALAPGYGIALAGLLLMGVGFALVIPLSMSVVAGAAGANAGRAIAIVATLGYSGFTVGPPTLGFIIESFGFPAAFLAMGALALTACAGFPAYRLLASKAARG